MNLAEVARRLPGPEFEELVEKAFQAGSLGSGGFRVQNIRAIANRTMVTVRYENGEETEIELSGNQAHT